MTTAMQRWVRHATRSFINPEQRRAVRLERARWGERILHLIHAHYAGGGANEDTALRVLQDLGVEPVPGEGTSTGSENVWRLNKLIAQSLEDMFGAFRVFTHWQDDRHPVLRVGTVEDVTVTYMVHRVDMSPDSPVRVIIDTSVVRKLAHQDVDAFDVSAVHALDSRPAFSLADGTVLELLHDLEFGSIDFAAWRHTVSELSCILDPQMPVAPGGRELAAAWSYMPTARSEAVGSDRHRRELWSHLAAAQSREDLLREHFYSTCDGRTVGVRLQPEILEPRVQQTEETFRRAIDRVVKNARDGRGRLRSVDEIVETILAALSNRMSVADAERLDLATRYVARRVIEAARGTEPYRPTRNDALDWELLFTLPLPAVVCTDDKRLLRFVRRLGGSQTDSVLAPAELVEALV